MTSTPGFVAAGVRCGLKTSREPDLGLLASEGPSVSAMVDTRNALPAAAITRNRRYPRNGFRAVVVNSGSANAATGSPGVDDAEAMAARAAGALGLSPWEVAVSSTGTIGDRLDLPRVVAGIDDALDARSPEGGHAFGRAICTTDAAPKGGAFRVGLRGGVVTIGVAAKGAGMIRPHMATMLAYLTTDAGIDAAALQAMTAAAAASSFNRISVDGQMSPSDAVLVMASGSAGGLSAEDIARFGDALSAVMRWVALQIVRDGEGSSHVVRVLVSGAADDDEAERVTRAVGDSPLVKTAIAGRDPSGGRVLQAVGQALAGAAGDPGVVVVGVNGIPCDADRRDEAAVAMAAGEYDLTIGLSRGDGSSEAWFSDLTHDYVTINTDYRT